MRKVICKGLMMYKYPNENKFCVKKKRSELKYLNNYEKIKRETVSSDERKR